MASERDIKLRAILEAGRLIAEARRAEDALGGIDKGAKKGSQSLDLIKKGALALGAAFTAAKIKDFAAQSIQLATAAEDAGSKFNAVFGPAVEDVSRFVDEFANKAGFAKFELEDMLGTTGNVAQGLGATTTESAALAETLATLAGDAASFNGATKDTPQVLAAFQSALTGEREALKTYGIVINEADVQTQAFTETGKTAASELTKLEKAQATVTLITERMGNAVGDLDRTTDSMSNRQARLSAEFKDTQVALGEALLPAMESFVSIGLDLVPLLGAVFEGVAEIAQPFGELSSIIEGVTDNLNDNRESSRSWLDIAKDTGRFLARLNPLYRTQQDGLAGTTRELEAQAAALAETSAALDAGRHSVERNRDATDKLLDTTGDANTESGFWERTLGRRLNPTLEESRRKLDDVTRSLEEQRDEMRRAADPVFALRDAQQKLGDAQDRLNELASTGKTNTQEYEDAQFDLIKASADLRVAQGALGDSMVAPGGSIAAFREMAAGAGFSKDEIDDLIDAILRYNQTDINTKSFVFRVAGSGGTVTVTKGDNVALAHGGIVKARHGGITATLGEGGTDEAVLPLNSQGAAAAADIFGAGTGTIIIPVTIGGTKVDEVIVDTNRRIARRGRR